MFFIHCTPLVCITLPLSSRTWSGRPELKDLVEKMGLGDLRNALKEGLAGGALRHPVS